MKGQIYLVILAIYISISSLYSQDTIYIPAQFPTIQMGLDNAIENSVVSVSPGVYYENIIWTNGIKGIHLIGSKGSDSTIVNGNQLGDVIFKDIENDANSIIRGLTLRNANGSGLNLLGVGTSLQDIVSIYNDRGAFLRDYQGSISDCKFLNNSPWGGLRIELSGNLYMENIQTKYNTSHVTSSGSGGSGTSMGAGLRISGGSHSVELKNVDVIGNLSTHTTRASHPGAMIYCDNLAIDSSSFWLNRAVLSATISEGGGLFVNVNSGELKNSTIGYNQSKAYSGMTFNNVEESFEVINTKFIGHGSEVTVLAESPGGDFFFENCLFANNEGFGIFFLATIGIQDRSATFNHCTFANNGQSSIISSYGDVLITNSILWNDYDEPYNELSQDFGAAPNATVRSSIMKGGYIGNLIIDEDPLLDPNTFIPAYNSPAYQFGNPNYSPLSGLNGVSRPTPVNTLPDLGAFEINQARSYVDIKFYFDENQNGILDNNEYKLKLGGITFEDELYNNFKKGGLTVEIDTGNHIIEYSDPTHNFWELTSANQLFVNVPDSSFYQELQFGLIPKNDSTEVDTKIVMDAYRCGENINGELIVYNEFLPIQGTTLWIELDNRVSDIKFEKDPDYTINDHYIGWDITELQPDEILSFPFTLNVPNINSAEELGSIHTFKSWCEGYEEKSSFTYSPELRCSYDPNDKLVQPISIKEYYPENTDLLYTIRFQNTGNDYAKDVTLIDTLNAELELKSFQYVSSSHPENLEIKTRDNNILEFHFNDIFLIDSLSSDEESQGYISFKISPIQGLAANDVVENTAYIIFDSNSAIITDISRTEIVGLVSIKDSEIEGQYEVYPNPVKDYFYLNNEYDDLEVYDTNGKLHSKHKNVKKIYVSNWSSGIYLLRIRKGNEVFLSKLSKVR